MSDFAKQAQEAAEQYLTAIQKIQDASLDAISRVVSSIPDAAKDAQKNPYMHAHYAQELYESAITDYVDQGYVDQRAYTAYVSFTEKLVTTQKSYTEKFLAAVKPELETYSERSHVSYRTNPAEKPSVRAPAPPAVQTRTGRPEDRSDLSEALRAVIEALSPTEITEFISGVVDARSDADGLDVTLWGPPPSTAEATRAVMANLKARYAARRAVLTQSITRGEAAQLLGISDQAVSDHLAAGDLVGLKDGRVWKLPAWQFDADSENGWLPGIAALRRYFPAGPVTLSAWVTTPNIDLNDRLPADVLAAGDIDQVLLVAQADGSAW